MACCVRQCKNFVTCSSDCQLFPLPDEMEHREIFCKMLDIPQEISSLKTAKVCSLHFKSKNPNATLKALEKLQNLPTYSIHDQNSSGESPQVVETISLSADNNSVPEQFPNLVTVVSNVPLVLGSSNELSNDNCDDMSTECSSFSNIMSTEFPSSNILMSTECSSSSNIMPTECPSSSNIIPTEGTSSSHIMPTEGTSSSNIMITECSSSSNKSTKCSSSSNTGTSMCSEVISIPPESSSSINLKASNSNNTLASEGQNSSDVICSSLNSVMLGDSLTRQVMLSKVPVLSNVALSDGSKSYTVAPENPSLSSITVSDGSKGCTVTPENRSFSTIILTDSSKNYIVVPEISNSDNVTVPNSVCNLISYEGSCSGTTMLTERSNFQLHSEVMESIPANDTVATLDLQCQDDELSEAQSNAYFKELTAYVSANEIVHRIESNSFLNTYAQITSNSPIMALERMRMPQFLQQCSRPGQPRTYIQPTVPRVMGTPLTSLTATQNPKTYSIRQQKSTLHYQPIEPSPLSFSQPVLSSESSTSAQIQPMRTYVSRPQHNSSVCPPVNNRPINRNFRPYHNSTIRPFGPLGPAVKSSQVQIIPPTDRPPSVANPNGPMLSNMNASTFSGAAFSLKNLADKSLNVQNSFSLQSLLEQAGIFKPGAVSGGTVSDSPGLTNQLPKQINSENGQIVQRNMEKQINESAIVVEPIIASIVGTEENPIEEHPTLIIENVTGATTQPQSKDDTEVEVIEVRVEKPARKVRPILPAVMQQSIPVHPIKPTVMQQSIPVESSLKKKKMYEWRYKNVYTPMPGASLEGTLFSLQKEIPIMPCPPLRDSTIEEFFKIIMPPKNRLDDANTLREQLRNELYACTSAHWLNNLRCLQKPPPCKNCNAKGFLLTTDVTMPDNVKLVCGTPKCKYPYPLQRPPFFTLFKSCSLVNIMLMTYHWACLSPLQEMMQDLDVPESEVIRYFRAVRRLCKNRMALEMNKIGGQKHFVEVAAVKMLNFFVICAYDRKTTHVRLDTFEENDVYSATFVSDLFTRWFNIKSIIVTTIAQRSLPPAKLNLVSVAADPNISLSRDNRQHILNAENFLFGNLSYMYKSTNPPQNKEAFQSLLDEIEWRSMYGPKMENILQQIITQILACDSETKYKTVIHPGPQHLSDLISKMPDKIHSRWCPDTPLNGVKKYKRKLRQPGEKGSPVKKIPQWQRTRTIAKDPPGKNSAASLFVTVPKVIGLKRCADINPVSLLMVNVVKHYSSYTTSDAVRLGIRLRSEGFTDNSVNWLIQQHYLPGTSLCQNLQCDQQAVLTSTGIWSCEACGEQWPLCRPKELSSFSDMQLPQICPLIYHWTVQSVIGSVNVDAHLSKQRVLQAWGAFQKLCAAALVRHNQLTMGGLIEVGLVQIGPVFVLGALDRKKDLILMSAFGEDLHTQIHYVYRTLQKWILPNSTIFINAMESFDLKGPYNVVGGFYTDDVTRKLKSFLQTCFSHLNHKLLTPVIVQPFLNERMWRDRFGRDPQQAFYSIMSEIFNRELPVVVPLAEDDKQNDVVCKQAKIVLERIPEDLLKKYNIELPSDKPKSEESQLADEEEDESSDSDSSASIPWLVASDSSDSLESGSPAHSSALEEDDEDDVEEDDGDVVAVVSGEEDEIVEKQKSAGKEQNPIVEEEEDIEEEESDIEVERLSTDDAPLEIEPEQFVIEDADVEMVEEGIHVLENNTIEMEENRVVEDEASTPPIQKLVICKKKRGAHYFIQRSDSSSEDSQTSAPQKPKKAKEDTSEIRRLQGITSKELIQLRKRHTPSKNDKVCIECGEEVAPNLEHYMKLFSCSDCKYKTCCQAAFLAHRGSVLFGRRLTPPRPPYGLHRPQRHYPTECEACGLKTFHPHLMASHLIQCKHTTCLLYHS